MSCHAGCFGFRPVEQFGYVLTLVKCRLPHLGTRHMTRGVLDVGVNSGAPFRYGQSGILCTSRLWQTALLGRLPAVGNGSLSLAPIASKLSTPPRPQLTHHSARL